MKARVAGDEPFAWWGSVWTPPAPRTVPDLIAGGVLSAETAAALWTLLARRASLVVVAGPSGAGKTTLLTALLDLLPPGTRRLYLRGCYEPFGFFDDPAVDPRRTVLLVNEISAHLPTYLWGPGVRRFLAARSRGFALAATAHATSVAEFVALLAGYPLRVPPAEIAAVDLVVVLDAWWEGEAVRREVGGVVALERAGAADGLVVTDLVAGGGRGKSALLDINQIARIVVGLGGGKEDPASVVDEVRQRAVSLRGMADDGAGDAGAELTELSRR